MIPLRLAIAAAGAAALFGAGVWVGYEWRDGEAAKAELERQQTEQRTTLRRQEAATGAAQTYEEARDAIRRDLLATMPRVAPALAVPVAQGCPAVGDVVIGAGALDRVRAAAGEPAAGTDPAKPRQAVPPGPGAADR